MMSVVTKRCRDDKNLRVSLLVIGLFFLTIAVPLYLKMYAVAIAWAAEGVALTLIGRRYRNIWAQLGGGAAFVLSLGQLIHRLPTHTAAFDVVFNPAFGTWCFVSAAIFIVHLIYRRNRDLPEKLRDEISQFLYTAGTLLLMAAAMMEWYWYCEYNIADGSLADMYLIRGMILIFAAFTLVFVLRPICLRGMWCKIFGSLTAGAGAVYTLLTFTEIYKSSFTILANLNFVIALLFVAGLFIGARLLKRDEEETQYNSVFSASFALAAIGVLWVLLTEEIYLYWYWQNQISENVDNWRFMAQMYISLMWAAYGAALMIAGFIRKNKALRYIALGLFGLLLAKVFILDTSTVKNVYRIAAFLATGLTLVAVSYLYQFLKNKGFFEMMLAEKKADEVPGEK